MKIKIADSHTDFLTVIGNKKQREKYISECVKNGTTTICCAVFTTEGNITLNDIKNFSIELKEYEKKFNIKLLLTIEDIGFIKDENELNELIKIKPFSINLTWNYENKFAGGALTNKGLTSFGIKAIKELEKHKILIDTAHLSKKSFYEFISLTTLPIFNSHCNISALFYHARNLSNVQIKKIVNSGGFLGLTLYEKFISSNKISSLNIAKQISYLFNKFGADFFGFGTDFFGIDFSYTPTDIKSYADFYKINNALNQLGFSKNEIEKVMFKNFEKFVLKIQ